MRIRTLVHGIATFVPGVRYLRAKGTGGSNSARYCYSVWLRHLLMAHRSGLDSCPRVVAELGPGDSLGIGLMALLCGSTRYLACDVVAHADPPRNLAVFEDLVLLLRNQSPLPDESEFPDIQPSLDSHEFPVEVLSPGRLSQALEERRLDTIRESLRAPDREDSLIQYRVPWSDPSIVEAGSIDMIFSQAVLEHVDDLPNAYGLMSLWLKPGGYVSHQIDFRSHGTATEWNGHWAYSEFVWKLMRGKRAYLLNRLPLSAHRRLLEKEGFETVCEEKASTKSNLRRDSLAPRFRELSDEDLTTSAVFIQARKPVIDRPR